MPTRNNTNVRVHLQGYKLASAGMRQLQTNLQESRDTVVNGVFRKFRDDVNDRVLHPTYELSKKYCIVNWGVPNRLIENMPRKRGYFTLNNSGTAVSSNKVMF